jgi:hypothetical protein
MEVSKIVNFSYIDFHLNVSIFERSSLFKRSEVIKTKIDPNIFTYFSSKYVILL